MKLDWAQTLRTIMLGDRPIQPASNNPVVYATEPNFVDKLDIMIEFQKLINDSHLSNFQMVSRVGRAKRFESEYIKDIRKDIQSLQVKLNRAKLAKNKQEIRKFEDELKWQTSLFSQAELFELLSSSNTNLVVPYTPNSFLGR